MRLLKELAACGAAWIAALSLAGCGSEPAPEAPAKKLAPTSKPASRPAAVEEEPMEPEAPVANAMEESAATDAGATGDDPAEGAPAPATGDVAPAADAEKKAESIEKAVENAPADGEKNAMAAPDKKMYDGVPYGERLTMSAGGNEFASIDDPNDPRLADYPLQTCVVTGKPLGADAYSFEYGGLTVRLADKAAYAEFMKDPAKHAGAVKRAHKEAASAAAK